MKNDVTLRSIKPGKKIEMDDEARNLLVLHSGSQNRKKPIGGCNNRLSRYFIVRLHSSGQTVVRSLPYAARGIPEIS